MLLDRLENENFLNLVEKFEGEAEILLLKFYLFFNLNKLEEMEKLINTMNIKEPDSIPTQICSILFNLYKNNDFEFGINTLQVINKNHQITPKIFNFIGISLMSKGVFEEAAKALTFGKESCEKNGIASKDFTCLLVNLINCYRNLNRQDEIRNCEEILRKNDPKNNYFIKLNNFEQEFTKAIS
jgi:tetratricopeptide (TPR) repeat protein